MLMYEKTCVIPIIIIRDEAILELHNDDTHNAQQFKLLFVLILYVSSKICQL